MIISNTFTIRSTKKIKRNMNKKEVGKHTISHTDEIFGALRKLDPTKQSSGKGLDDEGGEKV